MNDKEALIKWLKEQPKIEKPMYPDDIDGMVATMDANHLKIREILGGKSKTFIFNGKIDTNKITDGKTEYLVTKYYEITDVLPRYFYQYNLTYKDLENQILPKYKIKTAKHILAFARQNKVNETEVKALNKSLADLGKWWKRTVDVTIDKSYITISTTPLAFALLGSYVCDHGSCFAGITYNCDRKYTIAIQPETFILTVRTEKPKDEKDPCIIRMIGFIAPDGSVGLTSAYPYDCHQFEIVVKFIGTQLFGEKFYLANNPQIVFSGGNIYNHYPNFILSSKSQVQKIELHAKQAYKMVGKINDN